MFLKKYKNKKDADEDAPMGPFSSGLLLLPAPLAQTPRVRGGLELLPLSGAVAGRGGGPAAAVVVAISSSATCVTNREVGRRPELLNTDANRRQDARRARGAAGGPGRGLCLGIRTATSSPISHPVRC